MEKELSLVEKLKKQREQLNARIEKMEALDKQRSRKADAKRKILVGAYYLAAAEKNGTMEEIKLALDKFLTRKVDRALFGLEPVKD